MNWALNPQEVDEPDEFEDTHECHRHLPIATPQAPIPPRYCRAHDSSEKRVKIEPSLRECTQCHVKLQSNYSDFTFCPPCSDKQQKCMICGDHAPVAGSYIPVRDMRQPCPAGPAMGTGAANATAVPRFC